MLPVVCCAGETRSLVYRRHHLGTSQSKLFGLLYRGAFRMSLEDSAQTDSPPRANDVYTTFRRGFQSAEDRKKIGAVMMAQAMEDMGVGVTSSVLLPKAVAPHVRYSPEKDTITYKIEEVDCNHVEHVTELCGERSVVLYYQYTPEFEFAVKETWTRMVCDLGDNEKKKHRRVPVEGGVHFRQDSVLAHSAVMSGYGPEDSPFRLHRGRHAPSKKPYTDRTVKGRVYCYGNVASVPPEKPGESVRTSKHLRDRVSSVLGLGVITIVKCSGMKKGPWDTSLDTWAKMGFCPRNGYVIGCILTERFMKSMDDIVDQGFSAEDFSERCDVLKKPTRYLDNDEQEFLKRYVSGGTLNAFVSTIPSWCAGHPVDDPHEFMMQKLDEWAPDGSARHPICENIVKALKNWLEDGICLQKKALQVRQRHLHPGRIVGLGGKTGHTIPGVG